MRKCTVRCLAFYLNDKTTGDNLSKINMQRYIMMKCRPTDLFTVSHLQIRLSPMFHFDKTDRFSLWIVLKSFWHIKFLLDSKNKSWTEMPNEFNQPVVHMNKNLIDKTRKCHNRIVIKMILERLGEYMKYLAMRWGNKLNALFSVSLTNPNGTKCIFFFQKEKWNWLKYFNLILDAAKCGKNSST